MECDGRLDMSTKLGLQMGLGFVALASMASPASAFIVLTVGGDSSCGYAFIQDAIDAAHDSPGEDYIFIASNRTYEDQHLVITDQDVDIEGGFTDCSDFDPGLDQTTIGGTSGHSVFEIEGTSHVLLGNMIITGAVMDADHSGGGIYFGGQGDLTLNLAWVFANQAGYGGGIDVSPFGPTTLNLIGSVVSANTALVSGGGIRVEGPTTLTVTHSPSQYDNYISQNTALGQDSDGGFGGGIEVLGPAVANFSSVLALNVGPNGGGIAAIATEDGPARVNVYTTDANSPVSIYGNHATTWGGGIYLSPYVDNGNNAILCMNDFAVDANVASNGAALFLRWDGFLGSIAYLNTPAGCTPPPDAVACAPATACNEMNDNRSELDDGTPSDGSTVYLMNDGAFAANRFAARRNVSLDGYLVEFAAHTATTDGNYVRLHNCLLVDNVVGDHLLNGDGNAAGSQMLVDNCTLANNQIESPGTAVIGGDLNFIGVTNSIVYQPEHEVVQFQGPPGDLTTAYVLTNSAASLNGGVGIVVDAPQFVEAANGDYHQARTSPGVDFAPATEGADLDGNSRNVDLADVVDRWGPMDVGAYEIQTQAVGGACSASDTIFCSGFDGL
jgi:hypothetical protein